MMPPDPHPLLPVGAQAVISTLLARIRDDVCTVQRPTGSVDETGAPSGGYTTVAVVPCRVIAPERVPNERIGGARFGPTTDYEVALPPTVVVTAEDRIIVNGRTLRVVADRDATSHGFESRVLAQAVEA